MNIFIIFLIIFIIFTIIIYFKKIEKFTYPTMCPSCEATEDCFNCENCGKCLTNDGREICVEGDYISPYFKKDCVKYYYREPIIYDYVFPSLV